MIINKCCDSAQDDTVASVHLTVFVSNDTSLYGAFVLSQRTGVKAHWGSPHVPVNIRAE